MQSSKATDARRRRPLALLFAVAALALPSAASAAVMTATYTGVITSGSDTGNKFGLGGNLAGAAFAATFTYDTTIFDFHTTQDAGGNHYDRLTGYFENTPIIGTSVTINGVTDVFTLNGPDYDLASQQYNHTATEDYVVSQVSTYDYDPTVSRYAMYEYAYANLYTAVATPLTLDTAFASGASSAISTARFLNYDAFNPETGMPENHYSFVGTPQHVTVSVAEAGAGAGAVPEPSTWALMILGFGAAGAVLRRRAPITQGL